MVHQPIFSYPGIPDYKSASYTLVHGISPGRIQVRCVAGTANPAPRGTARFSDPGTGVSILIPDCHVDSAHLEAAGSGEQMIRFDILDGRWRWRFGRISGQWNLRNKDGSAIVMGTEKKPRELAKLCLEAMGVRGADLGRMPDEARPFVDWDVTNPASALAGLADACGCAVVYKPGGRVSVEPIGVGRMLPLNGYTASGDAGYDPPELPLGIEFVAGATMYQVDLELEAVGEDVNGEIKLLDDLSYKPKKKPWSEIVVPECMDVEKKFRDLAQKSVYKMYRIKAPEYLPGIEKKKQNKIQSIDELLPLLGNQVEADEMPDDTRQRRPAWIYGKFTKKDTTFPIIPPRTKVDPNLNKKPEGLYTRSFNVDRERGLVIFSEPCYQFEQSTNGYKTKPADIRLRIAVNWRRPDTRGLEHWSTLRGKKTSKDNPIVIFRSDVALELYENHEKKKVFNNEKIVEQQAKFYLDQAVAELQPKPIGSGVYAGIQNIEPDGAIRQVMWSISDDGDMAAKTSASLNMEQLVADVSYEERRLLEKVQHSLKVQAQNQQAKAVR